MSRHSAYSRDHAALLNTLSNAPRLLLIQDLDGVCMGLVRDPLTRRLDRGYIDAARQLDGSFYVLTNGEHIGSRGVNAIVEQAFVPPEHPREQGFYLPGLAAGGVQLQDRRGAVSHPGVSEAELRFLADVPVRATRFLSTLLAGAPFHLEPHEIATLVGTTVLDNPASPTLNLNALHARLTQAPARYAALQEAVQAFMQTLLHEAQAAQLDDAFFVHYAPNLGRDARGDERMKPADATQAGTTDFQFMLKGAVKEVGVLVILNHYYYRYTGRWPLGAHFNARQAPREADALLQLALAHFDPALMPHLVGVGDTVTSQSHTLEDGTETYLRGGSDRGFLTLVQQLGEALGTPSTTVYIDSSGGEVRRPGIDAELLERAPHAPWEAFAGITDADDPLQLDVVFTGGHTQYVAFFRTLAQRRSARTAGP
ncbi:MAG: glucosylglycerol 3-phosphatase [Pseudoxanthomonas sp.]